MTRRWGYDLDYDKEIRDDDELLAMYDRAVKGNWIAFSPDYYTRLADLVVADPAVAASVGLSDEEVLELAYFLDRHPDDYVPLPGANTHGSAIWDGIQAIYPDALEDSMAALKATRRRAKTTLDRHRRNRIKYG